MPRATYLLITLIATVCCARIKQVTVTREVFYSREVFTSRIVERSNPKLITPSLSRPLLTISVRESLLSMAKEGHSTAIRLVRLIDGRDEPDKTTSLFYAKFTAAYTDCKLDDKAVKTACVPSAMYERSKSFVMFCSVKKYYSMFNTVNREGLQQITLKKVYSEDCPLDPTREMILCSGYVESSGKRTGQRLHCEPAGNYEKSKIAP